MKRIAIIAAVAASLAAPAIADTAFAIQHFNQDADSIGDMRLVASDAGRVAVSTSGMSPLNDVFAELNASQDSAGDLRGVTGATVVLSNHSAAASEIFAQLRAESLENE
ncbi:MAG: hypothetical protein RIB61_09025 [Roseicyclus sp.]|jgi:hypothetical protein